MDAPPRPCTGVAADEQRTTRMRLTDDAAAMITELVAAQDLPDGAGLRIA